MAKAERKCVSDKQSTWWGTYNWPTPVYSRFSHLHDLENLADNVHLLKSAMSHLGSTHELGLSIDSGHGWLNGPDLSDMAVFDSRCSELTQVFGKNFPVVNERKQAARTQLFQCAQIRTLQESSEIRRVFNRFRGTPGLASVDSMAIQDLENFRIAVDQPDFNPNAHVGRAPLQIESAVFHSIQQAPLLHQNTGNPGAGTQASTSASDPSLQGSVRVTARGLTDGYGSQAEGSKARRPQKTPQFPLIFNGYNLASEVGGGCHHFQRKVASPKSFPLQPGTLSETQAQWLMENLWAQRAFLSAYTTSIFANRDRFAHVHSFHLAKISSGLLSCLEQEDFWNSLPGLTNLTMLISPDWRAEYITGDQSFNHSMAISPTAASLQFAQFLETYVAPLERLSTLTIGFVGGGEDARGIMARNKHVLPAPISLAPRTWLSNHLDEPNPRSLVIFPHIRELKLRNAWLSPLMLEGFMIKCRDSSLRTLTLQSISLTANHCAGTRASQTKASQCTRPIYPPSMWLYESLPTANCWAAVIDRITPGATIVDQKYQAGLSGETAFLDEPEPLAGFRGFMSRLELISCGYVLVSGVEVRELNQYDVVIPDLNPQDDGLRTRTSALAEKGVMLSEKKPGSGNEWPLLGKLTQCIHPIEKRVLEEAWGMKFGWGDDSSRWDAVEDGCFEGGTGRFSGAITR
jgi:hypothetical protein